MSVSKVSREFDVNANQIFTWRRQLKCSRPVVAAVPSAMAFAVVDVAPEDAAITSPIVLEFNWGLSIRVGADVDLARLTQVIRAARAAS